MPAIGGLLFRPELFKKLAGCTKLERLSDLEELTLRCRTVHAREHISEAVAAYRGGAYRAAIVMSWIAVVFDLIDKVRELKIAGDAAATTLLDKFENYQSQIHQNDPKAVKQALEFERNLLTEVSTKLSLIDALQLSDLLRLKDDRHRCAHPTFTSIGDAFRPSAELARLHLRNAIAHVLSQPPVQGKAALADLETLITSAYFPTDFSKAHTQLASSALNRATASLIKAFVDQLIFGYLDPKHKYYELPKIITVLSVVVETHRSEAEPRITEQLRKVIRIASDDDLPLAVTLVANVFWNYLDVSGQEKIMQLIINADFIDIEDIIPNLSTIPDLDETIRDRLKKVTGFALARVLDEIPLQSIAVDAAVDKYISAPSYEKARFGRRKLIYPIIDILQDHHIRQIIEGASNNSQVSDETYFERLVQKLADRNMIPASDFEEMLNDAGFAEIARKITFT